MKRVYVHLAAIAFLIPLSGYILMPLSAQTNISMASPEVLAKIVNTKAEIERNIIRATPTSLALARDGLIQSKVVSEDDKNAMLEIIRGISCLLYPFPPRPKINDTGSGFFVDPSIKNIYPVYSVCLTQLVEAFQGRIFAAPKGSEGAFLAEILPALAIFKTMDRETARTALGYVERFDASNSFVSTIPGLVRARYARITGDLLGAYTGYKKVLDTYPDVWPARLELGVLSLELDRPVNALAFLAPLTESRNSDKFVIAPYSIALYENGEFADAEPFALKGLEYDPDSFELALIAAHIFIDKNDFSAAQPYLDAIGKKKASDRMYLYLKAVYAKGQNRYDEALKWARKALQTYPGDPEVMVLLAGILFAGPDTGHEEASALCLEARKLFENVQLAPPGPILAGPIPAGAGLPPPSPLKTAMREEAKSEATRFLMLEAYNHQDWYKAATMLEDSSSTGLDKAVIATILRKSGRTREALAFSSEWYKEAPQEESAVEAYLRSLAASSTGIGVASAATSGVSDASSGLLGLAAGYSQGGLSPSLESGQAPLIGLVLKLLSGSCSKGMLSYLHYLRGTLQTDPDAAIDSYRLALLERGDNVEALAALAKAYSRKNDAQKALFYIKQARSIGIDDMDLAAELKALEASISQE